LQFRCRGSRRESAVAQLFSLGITMDTPTITKPSFLKELIALFLFLVVGGFFALPTLSIPGSIAGKYKMIFFLLVYGRLVWSVFRRKFLVGDYLAYFVIVISFCFLADFCMDLVW
jgi:hypothetical protein